MNLYCSLLVSLAQTPTKGSISPYFSYSISTVIRRVLFMKAVPPKTFAKKTRILRKDRSGELHKLPNVINQTKCSVAKPPSLPKAVLSRSSTQARNQLIHIR